MDVCATDVVVCAVLTVAAAPALADPRGQDTLLALTSLRSGVQHPNAQKETGILARASTWA